MWVDIQDLIMYATFGDNRLRGLGCYWQLTTAIMFALFNNNDEEKITDETRLDIPNITNSGILLTILTKSFT